MVKVFMDAYGCVENMVDAGRYRDFLENHGYCFTNDFMEADVIIFFTCGVTSYTAKECSMRMKMLSEKKKENARLLVGGCLPIIEKEKMEDGAVFRTSHNDFSALASLLGIENCDFSSNQFTNSMFLAPDKEEEQEGYAAFKRKMAELAKLEKQLLMGKSRKEMNQYTYFGRVSEEIYKDAYFVPISRGCGGNCAYCAVKHVKGDTKSNPVEEILSQISQGYERGYHEIVLSGDDTGSYGKDIDEDFYSLMKQITELDLPLNYTLRNFEPFWLTNNEERFDELLSMGRIVNVCIPIQSASKKVVASMGRNYDPLKILSLIDRYKRLYPDIVWSTHMMLGFPGEDDDDYKESLDCIGDRFDYVKHSMYTDRPNTRSLEYPDKVSAAVKKLRMMEFEKCTQSTLKERYREKVNSLPEELKKTLEKVLNDE